MYVVIATSIVLHMRFPDVPAASLDGMPTQLDSLIVMDMGQHVLRDFSSPMQLHQVLVPGLEVGAEHVIKGNDPCWRPQRRFDCKTATV